MVDTLLRVRSQMLLVLVSFALAAAACTIPQPLLTPQPIAGAATPAQTRVAIVRALLENDYVLDSEKPGVILARYSRSDWTYLVEIAYSNEVTIRYVSSKNLQYGTSENGATVIHRGYNNRVLHLSKEIGKEIMIARVTDTLPPVASPPPAEVVPD
jgi:hypothetical protein